jgi:hypothetical protein
VNEVEQLACQPDSPAGQAGRGPKPNNDAEVSENGTYETLALIAQAGWIGEKNRPNEEISLFRIVGTEAPYSGIFVPR